MSEGSCPQTKKGRLKSFRRPFFNNILADVDVRARVQVAQQVCCGLLGFLSGHILAYGVALALFGRTGVTDVVQLDDVPAELCAYGRADFDRV